MMDGQKIIVEINKETDFEQGAIIKMPSTKFPVMHNGKPIGECKRVWKEGKIIKAEIKLIDAGFLIGFYKEGQDVIVSYLELMVGD